jgi:hypothetical protein
MAGRQRVMATYRRSPLWAVVDLGTVVDVEYVDNAAVLVDAVDDAIRAASSAVTTRERPEQRPSCARAPTPATGVRTGPPTTAVWMRSWHLQ